MISTLRTKLSKKLPLFVYLLFVLQILMDVLSFWMAELGMGNTLTLLLRLAVFGLTLLLGFSLSRRKRIYWFAAAVMLFIAAGHIFAIRQYGCTDLVGDLTNFVRVIQMPVLVLCLITFLRENEDCYPAMKWGMLSCLLLILLVQVLAVLTGTEPHTYHDGSGYIGWFNNTNSQSSNLTMLAPVAIAWVYHKRGFKSPLFWVTMLGSFVAMFFLGTRLAYLGLGATGLGLGLSLIIIDRRQWKKALVFFAIVAVFAGLIPLSPMVRHQKTYEDFQAQRQASINNSLNFEDLPSMWETGISEEERAARKAIWLEALTPIYEFYVPDFVEMFGAEKTIEMYNYSYNIYTITSTRPKKLQFARLLMDDSPASARLFGLELSRFTVGENIYDVENDFHGIYFLYGYAGLAAMLLFLLYFVWLILRALLKNAKRYFTWDAAAWGIAFLMVLPHIYCTAGVLRRPSASIYLSAALAAIYYLVKIRKYPEEPQKLTKES